MKRLGRQRFTSNKEDAQTNAFSESLQNFCFLDGLSVQTVVKVYKSKRNTLQNKKVLKCFDFLSLNEELVNDFRT